MQTINLTCLSDLPHVSQILTGFYMIGKSRDDVEVVINDGIGKRGSTAELPAAVEVIYRGKRIIYDVDDGYQHAEGIRALISDCDFYFKRSFSKSQNERLLPEYLDKIHPLGLNYFVTYKGNPLNERPSLRRLVRRIFSGRSEFTAESYESHKEYANRHPKIVFYTRVRPPKSGISKQLQDERDYINRTRIDIVRALKERYGRNFSGGVVASKYAKKLCPDLVLPYHKTRKSAYLRRMHKSDICIGTMGVHESIGWKTAEYVAASKAIVNEELKYAVTGNFEKGKNYLEFTSVDDCLAAVERLVFDSALRNEMKKRNREYYDEYLHPKKLIESSLKIVDERI
ncbi:MAG: hypothetical protein IJD17_06685 [Clostridia bacterium]|nr:hypothetical protein [Clostridia bacterium]